MYIIGFDPTLFQEFYGQTIVYDKTAYNSILVSVNFIRVIGV